MFQSPAAISLASTNGVPRFTEKILPLTSSIIPDPPLPWKIYPATSEVSAPVLSVIEISPLASLGEAVAPPTA